MFLIYWCYIEPFSNISISEHIDLSVNLYMFNLESQILTPQLTVGKMANEGPCYLLKLFILEMNQYIVTCILR